MRLSTLSGKLIIALHISQKERVVFTYLSMSSSINSEKKIVNTITITHLKTHLEY